MKTALSSALSLTILSQSISSCRSFSVPISKTVIPLTLLPDDDNTQPPRKVLHGNLSVRARSVPIGTPTIDTITIWEVEDPSALMQEWYEPEVQRINNNVVVDPFGVIMWPGSILASKELVQHQDKVAQSSTVLVLGAGTGVEAQCAALLGASQVIALDISPLALQLLQLGAEQAGVGGIVKAVQWDLFSSQPLPECDILVAADVLYNAELAQQIGKRVIEVLQRESPPALLITDSQRFHGTDFLGSVNEIVPDREPLQWEYFELQNVRGSGILIAEDQTYDSTTRMVSTGW